MEELIAEFRAAFPEFLDAESYPGSAIQFWLEMAQAFFSEKRFGVLYKKVLLLFLAHKMALHGQNQKAVAGGNAGFTDGGAIASKSVGGASVSYQTNAAYDDAGEYALTQYGRALWAILRPFGIGCLQL